MLFARKFGDKYGKKLVGNLVGNKIADKITSIGKTYVTIEDRKNNRRNIRFTRKKTINYWWS